MTAAALPKPDYGKDAPELRGGFQLASAHRLWDYVHILQSLGWWRAQLWLISYLFLSPARALRATKP